MALWEGGGVAEAAGEDFRLGYDCGGGVGEEEAFAGVEGFAHEGGFGFLFGGLEGS